MSWFGSKNNVMPETDAARRQRLSSPAPVAPTSLLGGLQPPDASQARSAATTDAVAAAKKAKKRAGAGSLVTTQPVGKINTPGTLVPKSLVGY